MSRRSGAIVALVSFWGCLFLSGCSGFGSVRIEPEALVNAVQGERTARKTPEVLVLGTSDANWNRVKFVSLMNNEVKALPYPYDSIELIRLSVDEMAEIRLMEKGSRAGWGFLWGMIPGAVMTLAGLSSNGDLYYNPGPLIGIGGGLIGLLVKTLSVPKTKFDFRGMPRPEKIRCLEKLMGI